MDVLQNGMVIWVGPDPRGGYHYLTYNPFKNGRAVCFEDSIPYLKRLGLDVGLHWKENMRMKGFHAVYHCDYHPLSGAEYASGWVKVSPTVEKLFQEGMTNKTFASLLRRDE